MSESILPRLLSRVALCAYLGDLPWSEVAFWIESGYLPGPLNGASVLDKNARWDSKAIDQALDEAPGGQNGVVIPLAAWHGPAARP
jgi:hypothetical protein